MRQPTTSHTRQPEGADPYGTHVPVLAAIGAAVPVTRVLELGGGHYSTGLLLDRAVFPDLSLLVTVETDPHWAVRIRKENGRHHVVVVARAAQAVEWLLPRGLFDLTLVDDSASMTERIGTLRAVSAARPRGLVVIHDFEHADYREATDFDQTAVFDRLTPWTAVAWNEGSPHGGERLHRVVAGA